MVISPCIKLRPKSLKKTFTSTSLIKFRIEASVSELLKTDLILNLNSCLDGEISFTLKIDIGEFNIFLLSKFNLILNFPDV